MIRLNADYLLFRLANGESVPLRPEMIAIEVAHQEGSIFDAEFVNHVAAAVFHYFKHEMARESVSIAEFAATLEDVLRGFAAADVSAGGPRVLESDLTRLADESGGSELFFFPRLRDELRARLNQSPRVLRFRGLRGCAKQLTGSRRWTNRCRELQDQIVNYLRGCFVAEPRPQDCALLVE